MRGRGERPDWCSSVLGTWSKAQQMSPNLIVAVIVIVSHTHLYLAYSQHVGFLLTKDWRFTEVKKSAPMIWTEEDSSLCHSHFSHYHQAPHPGLSIHGTHQEWLKSLLCAGNAGEPRETKISYDIQIDAGSA